MKKIVVALFILVTVLSCSKESLQSRELNISLKSIKGVVNAVNTPNVGFYPNPFQDIIRIHLTGSEDAMLFISNNNGNTKQLYMASPDVDLDFSNERSGTYYCEVRMNKTVFRTYLIKK